MVLRRFFSIAAAGSRHVRPALGYLAAIGAVVMLTAFAVVQGIGALPGSAQHLAAADDAPITDARVLDSFAMESFIYRGPPHKVAREQRAAVASKPAVLAKPKTYVLAPTPYAGMFLGAPPATIAAASSEVDDEAPEQSRSTPVATYRTVCVRLCDGYYFPISYATTPDHFVKDSAKCEASCGSPARLYVHENPGSESETMEDLSGRPYSELKTAFVYRTEYVPNCSCKAQPWEQETQDRHRLYALADSEQKLWSDMSKTLDGKRKAKKADKQAVAELKAAATAQSVVLKAEMKEFKEKIAAQETTRKQAAATVVAAKGIDVSTGKKKRFASKRSTKPKAPTSMVAAAPGAPLATGAVPGVTPLSAAAAAPPPASWGQPMALGGAKPRPKIWGNGPNAHAAPSGTGAGDEFRRNFY